MSDESLTPQEKAEIAQLMRDASSLPPLEAPPADLFARIQEAQAPVPLATQAGRYMRDTLMLAAAVLAVVGLALAAQFISGAENVEVLASVDIVNDGLPVSDDAKGVARLVEVDGATFLEVDVESLETDDGYLELWVIKPDVSDMHSLGEVDGNGRYPWPEGVDSSEFNLIDISVEERDGVEAHSGNSVLRGLLDV